MTERRFCLCQNENDLVQYAVFEVKCVVSVMRMVACDFEWEVDLDQRMQSRAHTFVKL